MIEEAFGLEGPPFKLSPDPKFFFGSRSHNKAMAYLHFGLQQAEGFIVITGEIGAGKSMLIGHLLDQLDRKKVTAATIVTSRMEAEDVLSYVLGAFRIEPTSQGRAAQLEAFQEFLLEQFDQGRRVLLIIDEAQNLPKRTIEELRMLSNIDRDGAPLFQMFLVGQPEFKTILSASDMEQLRQRVIASYHLEALSETETQGYIEHRLKTVGWSGNPEFHADAVQRIYANSGGVPRRINTLCSRVLLFAAIEERKAIDLEVVEAVIADMASEDLVDTAGPRRDGAPAPEAPKEPAPPAPAAAEQAQPYYGAEDEEDASEPVAASLEDIAGEIAAVSKATNGAAPVERAHADGAPAAKNAVSRETPARRTKDAAAVRAAKARLMAAREKLIAIAERLREAEAGKRRRRAAQKAHIDRASALAAELRESLSRESGGAK